MSITTWGLSQRKERWMVKVMGNLMCTKMESIQELDRFLIQQNWAEANVKVPLTFLIKMQLS
jgi:hypothetical protein